MWTLCDSGLSPHLDKFNLGISHLGKRSVSQIRTGKQPTNQPVKDKPTKQPMKQQHLNRFVMGVKTILGTSSESLTYFIVIKMARSLRGRKSKKTREVMQVVPIF